MSGKFIVKQKKANKPVTTSLRLEEELLQAYDELAGKSNLSRNELICMALRFALDNLEFIPKDSTKE